MKALLEAVANYDDETSISTFTDFDLETSDENTQKLVEIIYRIKDLANQVADLWDEIGGGGGGNSLTDRVEALEEASKTHAHLDHYVLN